MDKLPRDPGKQSSDGAAGYARGFRDARGHGVVGGWRNFMRSIRGEPEPDSRREAERDRQREAEK